MSHIIVVADSSRARIFTPGSGTSGLEEIETMAHPEGRLHQQDMVSDLPGKNAGKGGGGDHAFQEIVEPKQEEVIKFAKRIADYLDGVRTANKMDKLSIIAAPAFLGELREQLTDDTSKQVVFELDKNLTQHSPEEISSHCA